MKWLMALTMGVVIFSARARACEQARLQAYNVVWTSEGLSAEDSMPVGGHDIGLNVWVENGEVLIYLNRDGSFDENNSLLRLGRLRLRLEPNPFANPTLALRQELRLRQSEMAIQAVEETGTPQARPRVQILIWVEVDRPVVHVEIESLEPLTARVAYENWRTQDRPLSKPERQQCISFSGIEPERMTVLTRADVFEPGQTDFVWFHRNRNDDLLFDKAVRQQGLDEVKAQLWNPQRDFTFGGLMRGSGMAFADTADGVRHDVPFRAWRYRSVAPTNHQEIELFLHSEGQKQTP